MKMFVAVVLAAALSVYPQYAFSQTVQPGATADTCPSCSARGEFAGKISEVLIKDTISKLNAVHTKQANLTLKSTDVRLAASSVNVLFKHFDEVKGANGQSYTWHMEKGIHDQRDAIRNHVGSLADATNLRNKLAKVGVSVTTSEALSVVQVSPDGRAQGLAYLKAHGLHGMRNLLIHQLHGLDNQVRARAALLPAPPQFKLMQYDSGDDFWTGLNDVIGWDANPDDTGEPLGAENPAFWTQYGISSMLGVPVYLDPNDPASILDQTYAAATLAPPSSDPCYYWVRVTEVLGAICVFTAGEEPLTAPACVAFIIAFASLEACRTLTGTSDNF